MKKAKRIKKSSVTIRDWGQMDSNVLIIIFQKLRISDLLLGVAQVCSEWRKAASHTNFFIEEHKLNLQLVEIRKLNKRMVPVYINLLKEALKTETNLFHLQFSERFMLPEQVILYIAKRSTSLKSLYLPDASLIKFFRTSLLPKILPYWENLTSFTAVVFSASTLDCIKIVGRYCKKLTHLGLHGFIAAPEAEIIVASFPELQSLDFEKCFFSEAALCIILNGAKNLKSIDLTHALCGKDDIQNSATKVIWEAGAMELKEQILDKLKALENFTYCGGNTCWDCFHLYKTGLPIKA